MCQSNQKGIKYYFFEFFDEKWKDDAFGGVEAHWGLFYQKYVLRIPPITTIDPLPIAKPSRASPSPTARLNTWTPLHPAAALTMTILILQFLGPPFLVTIDGLFHPPSYTLDSKCSYETFPPFSVSRPLNEAVMPLLLLFKTLELFAFNTYNCLALSSSPCTARTPDFHHPSPPSTPLHS